MLSFPFESVQSCEHYSLQELFKIVTRNHQHRCRSATIFTDVQRFYDQISSNFSENFCNVHQPGGPVPIFENFKKVMLDLAVPAVPENNQDDGKGRKHTTAHHRQRKERRMEEEDCRERVQQSLMTLCQRKTSRQKSSPRRMQKNLKEDL